jgi:PAS domain S-box-containing protein
MKKEFNILLIEDNDGDVRIIRELLKEQSSMIFNITHAGKLDDGIKIISKTTFDTILLDLGLPDSVGIETFLSLNKSFPNLATTIILTGLNDTEIGLIAVNSGAQDYIIKSQVDSEKLVKSIIYSYERSRLTRELRLQLEATRVAEEELQKDITTRKQAEEDLRIALVKYKTLFDNLPLGVTVSDERGKILEANPMAEKLLGLSQDEQKKRVIDGLEWQIVSPDGKTMPPEEFASVRALKERCVVENVEMGIIKPNNIITWINVTAAPLPLKGYGVIIAYNNITKRKLAEETNIHERNMLRTLIDNLPDMIYVKDIDCRKIIANEADVKNIGYTIEKDVLGKTDTELFPGQTGQRGLDDDKKVIRSGKAIINREEDFFDKVGVRRWLLTTKIPLNDKNGRTIGLVGIGHDITERKLIELELIEAKDRAEESDRLKTAFLHNISHEIRTPMNAIVGFCALLGEEYIDARTRQEYIEVILQSSNHLLAIISDIVDISNIEANLLKITKNGININLKLNSLYEQFLPLTSQKKIQLVFETGLADSDAFCITDSTKLTQILINLISNAIKFTDKGYVKVDCFLRDEFLEFRISDTGIGINQEYHGKIFDRFYQVQQTVSRIYEGTGLGLSISKANVELLGGKIWFASEPGKGTTFFFKIPYEKQTAETSVINLKRVTEGFVFPAKKTILVAEDTDSNFKLLGFFLSGTNIEIVRAVNGKEAVDICLSNKNIDLILMDIKMPVMDGYTASKLIREKNSAIPIIIQTAYSDDKEKAIEFGCSGFISKPFDKKGLLQIIHEFI